MHPIRLPGRAPMVSRLLASLLALSVLAPGGAGVAAAAPAQPAQRSAPHVAAPTRATAPYRATTGAPRKARPAAAPAGPITSSACSNPSSGTFTCDLYAETGSATMPDGTSVPIWGYAANATDPAGLPGPTLVVTQGSTVTITLHNVDLPVATSLGLSQLPVVPDTIGVTSGNVMSYTFTAARPGTYLYEAGLTPTGPQQIAMGLSGALIVRSNACATCAYGASTAFDDEGLVFLSEVDPAFNAAPFTSNLNYLAPKYWLVDGKGYPQTAPIGTDAGRTVLLRYVNAGLVQHSMSLLGLHEVLVGQDGNAEPNPSTVVADTIPEGSSVDALASIPPTAPAGTQYALFEGAMHLDNAGKLGPAAANPAITPIAFGGMLTFLTVAGTTTVAGGPVTSAVSVTPSPTNGTAPASLTATITSASSTVSAAEYFVDTVGASGTGCAISGSYGSAGVNVSATIPVSGATAPCVDLTTLASGNHTFYVHGEDASNVWGDPASDVLNLDKTGPSISGGKATPSLSNGTQAVTVQATASDVKSGGQNVTAAEYFIDPSGTPAPGSGTAFTMPTPASTVALSATIPAATVAGLGEGSHTVAIDAQDAVGNWGALGTVTFTLDKTGPNATAVTVAPSPTNGLFGLPNGSTGQVYELINATIGDPTAGGVSSGVVAAEYFIDSVGANGTGGGMLASSGSFGGSSVNVIGAAELYAIAALSNGNHTVYVHGKDGAGNWGPMATTTLVIDKTHPYITSAGIAPNPTGGATAVTLSVAVTDVANINRIEYFVGATDPGQGSATAITATTPLLPGANPTGTANVSLLNVPLGTTSVSVRARNVNGVWSPLTTLPLTVAPLFADGFESANTSKWSAVGGTAADLSVTAGAAQAGSYGMAAAIASGASGYVQDNTPFAELRYRDRFYLNPNGVTLTNLTAYTVFSAFNSTNATRYSVLLRRNGTQDQVAVSLVRNGGTTTSNWFNVANSAYTAIETSWSRSGNNLSLSLYTGGTLRQTVTGTSTTATQGTYRIDTVRMGPQGTLTGASGTIDFDSFVSTRTNPVIGL